MPHLLTRGTCSFRRGSKIDQNQELKISFGALFTYKWKMQSPAGYGKHFKFEGVGAIVLAEIPKMSVKKLIAYSPN